MSIKRLTAILLSAGLLMGGQVAAADQTADKPVKKIVINAASRLLTLYEGNDKLGMYPLGLGKPSTPTPVGYFQVHTKEIDPPWIDPSNPEYEVPSGESNPLGYRWMQIWGNYGIHGTNRPDSIGYYVSNGCVRMREADVETLFDMVEVGTPVEITYNRVVVEKTADDNIAYYIYPDGYGWQTIDAAYVNRWLAPYGVSAFESDDDIRQKIADSSGEPTYIGKAYPIVINGKRLDPWEQNGRTFDSKAVIRSGITYLPAVPIAMAIRTKLEWRAGAATLRTAYGEVVGFESKKQIYFNADDAIVLFNLDGGLQNLTSPVEDRSGNSITLGKVYNLQTVVPSTEIVVEPEPSDKKKRKKSEDKPTVETPSSDRPSSDRSSSDRPTTDRPSSDRSSSDRPTVDPSTVQTPMVGEGSSSGENKSVERPSSESPRVETPSDEGKTSKSSKKSKRAKNKTDGGSAAEGE